MKIHTFFRVVAGSAFILTLSIFILPARYVSATTNLVNNPSMEQVSTVATKPLGWNTNVWGSNKAIFEYKSEGYEGVRSVLVTMSRYASGDAKWFFDPVTVSPNTEYQVSDYYRSNVTTQVVVAVYDAKNKITYHNVHTNVPVSSTTWKNFVGTFKTPANAKKMTVYHLLAKNGWLQIDSASLSTTISPPPPVVNELPTNHSVETALNTTMPTGWVHGSWGTNSPTYQYVNGDGHDGVRSVKVTMANYQDGDAKWMFNSIPLGAGDYRFTGWYKTNTTPHVVVQYTFPDGSESFYGMPNPEPATNAVSVWQRYSDTFTVPVGVHGVTVFFFLTGNGWVQSDDYLIEPYTFPPFNRGLVTLTFDDGFEGNVTTALPKLAEYGFKTTHCFATQYVEGIPEQVANVQTIAHAGHEICAHTVTHPFLTKVSDTVLDYELGHAKSFLEGISGQQVTSFASPYGDYDARVNAKIKQYYASHRTTDEGFNAKDNLDPYSLRVQNMTPTTTLTEFTAWVNKAKADKTWLILLYHAITSTSPGAYDTPKADFDAQMATLAGSGVTVLTWKDALAEARAQ